MCQVAGCRLIRTNRCLCIFSMQKRMMLIDTPRWKPSVNTRFLPTFFNDTPMFGGRKNRQKEEAGARSQDQTPSGAALSGQGESVQAA